MKTCHVCGTKVDDYELTCPVCGATVVKATSGMTLRVSEPEPKKKVGPSIGTTVSTGSGYTDILRAEDDVDTEDYYGGSIPTSFSKNYIEDDGEHKAAKDKRFIKALVRIAIVAFFCAVGYMIFKNLLLDRAKTVDSADEALDIFVEAVNDQDTKDMKQIVPKHIKDRSDEAEYWIKDFNGEKISSYSIKDTYEYSQSEINSMEDTIEATTSRTAYIKSAKKLYVNLVFDTGNGGSKGVTAELVFIKVEGSWYLYYDESTIPRM